MPKTRAPKATTPKASQVTISEPADWRGQRLQRGGALGSDRAPWKLTVAVYRQKNSEDELTRVLCFGGLLLDVLKDALRDVEGSQGIQLLS